MSPEKKLKSLLEQEGRGAGTRLAEYLGVPRNYVSRWAKGVSRYQIPKEYLPKIAQFFGVPIEYFFDTDNKVRVKLVPFIGKASCGVPNEYVYEANEFIPIPSTFGDHIYAVEAEGDSMSPKINEGDVVLCDMDKEVRDGDIVHYTIDNESGIKKIKFTDNGVVLLPLNEKYSPIIYTNDQLEHIPFRITKCTRVFKDL